MCFTVMHVFTRQRVLLSYKICNNNALNQEYKDKKKKQT